MSESFGTGFDDEVHISHGLTVGAIEAVIEPSIGDPVRKVEMNTDKGRGIIADFASAVIGITNAASAASGFAKAIYEGVSNSDGGHAVDTTCIAQTIKAVLGKGGYPREVIDAIEKGDTVMVDDGNKTMVTIAKVDGKIMTTNTKSSGRIDIHVTPAPSGSGRCDQLSDAAVVEAHFSGASVSNGVVYCVNSGTLMGTAGEYAASARGSSDTGSDS